VQRGTGAITRIIALKPKLEAGAFANIFNGNMALPVEQWAKQS